MKVVLAVFAALLLCYSANAGLIQGIVSGISNDAPVQAALGAASSIVQALPVVNATGTATTNGQNNCYLAYGSTIYQVIVVGGAKLRFCEQDALQNLSTAQTSNTGMTASNCATQELSLITAQLNTAADQLTICLTSAAIGQL